jgi:hypothetical protein
MKKPFRATLNPGCGQIDASVYPVKPGLRNLPFADFRFQPAAVQIVPTKMIRLQSRSGHAGSRSVTVMITGNYGQLRPKNEKDVMRAFPLFSA